MHFLTSSNPHPHPHPPPTPFLFPKMCMLFLICLDLYIALNVVIYSCKIYTVMDEIDLLVSKKKTGLEICSTIDLNWLGGYNAVGLVITLLTEMRESLEELRKEMLLKHFEFISMNRKRSWNVVTGDLFKGAFLDSYFKDELTRLFFGVSFCFCVCYLAYLDYLRINFVNLMTDFL